MSFRPFLPWLMMLTLVSAGVPGNVPLVQAVDPVDQRQQTADELLQQGVQQYNRKQVSAALQSWQQALTLYRQLQNSQGEGLAVQYLGIAYQNQGDYRRAIAYYQLQLAWARQTGNRKVEANALGDLGSSLRMLGDYSQALRNYQASLQIRRELTDRRGEGQVLANLGNLQATLGNYEQAIAYQKQGLAINQEVNNSQGIILSLNSLGAHYAAQANYQVARQYYEQSLQAAQQIGFQAAAGNALNSLGSIAHAQRNFQGAIDYYQQALTVAEAIADLRLQAAASGGLGLAWTNLQDYPKALEYQQTAVRAARQLEDRSLEANVLNNLSYTWLKSGNPTAAEQSIQTALTLLESLRSNLTDADKVSIFDTQVRSYNTLQRIFVAQNQPEAALEVAERGRARVFVELLSRRLSAAKAQTFAALPTVQPPTLDEIRQIARTQNATLVEYAIIPDEDFIAQGKLKGADAQLFIWVIQPTGEITFRRHNLTHLQTSLADLVVSSREAIGVRGLSFQEDAAVVNQTTATSTGNQNARLQQLHQILIDPIADLLPQTPEQRVIFIPQGSLFFVPFGALQDKSGQYLIQKHTILTAPAIQVLDLTHQQAQNIRQLGLKTALVVGNPTMPSLSFEVGKPPKQLTNLPGAENEARAIAPLLNTQAILGKQATKIAIQRQMPMARIIHLATHGLLGKVDQSGIPGAIALAPSGQDRGLLTANEILNLRLNADLVVLSACDTGRGDITGDGVIGLSRALIAAGVPSVIVSLWKVPDIPTEVLMIKFYRNLQHNPDKSQALRQAMLATMKDYPDPKDWAAFTLIGESN